MFSDATVLELVLLFLVACIGIPSTALALSALAEVVVLYLRQRHWLKVQRMRGAL